MKAFEVMFGRRAFGRDCGVWARCCIDGIGAMEVTEVGKWRGLGKPERTI